MTIIYLEGAGADEPHGLAFYTVGAGWQHELIQEPCVGHIMPGPAENNPVAVPDVRDAYSMLLAAARNDTPVVDVSIVQPLITAFGASRATEASLRSVPPEALASRSAICFLPIALAVKCYEVRKAAAIEALSGIDDFQELDDRTRAELVLVMAERHGFMYCGRPTRPSFKFAGTKTKRFGISPGSFNCMGISRDTRHLLEPLDHRNIIITFDFNGIDTRSIISMDEEARSTYDMAEDVHARTAEILLGRRPDPEERRLAKESHHTYAYGGAVPDVLRQIYDEKFPWLRRLRDRFFDPIDHKHPGHALAIAAQTRSSIAFCAGLSDLLPMLGDDSGVWPLFTVHDELVVEARDVEHTERIARLLEGGAERVTGVRQIVNVRIGRNYGECK